MKLDFLILSKGRKKRREGEKMGIIDIFETVFLFGFDDFMSRLNKLIGSQNSVS
jgi:hypothetical protein